MHSIDNRISRRDFLRAIGISVIGTTTLTCIDSHTTQYAQAYAPDVIVARKLFKPVTVDGKWTYEDEWNEEGDTGIAYSRHDYVHHLNSDGSGKSICKIKHDDENVYWILEVLTDTSFMGRSTPPGGDGCAIFLFKNRYNYWFDGGWESSTEFVTKAMKKSGSMEGKYEVDHSLDDLYEIASSIGRSVYQTTPHVIYECRISKEFLEGRKEIPMNLVTVETETMTNMGWPTFFEYGKLQLSEEVVIPEYPLGMNQYSNVAGLGIAMTSLGILIGRLRSRDRITRREFLFRKR